MPSYQNKIQFYYQCVLLMVNILIKDGTGFIKIPLIKKIHSLGHYLKLLIGESSNTTPIAEFCKRILVLGNYRFICNYS